MSSAFTTIERQLSYGVIILLSDKFLKSRQMRKGFLRLSLSLSITLSLVPSALSQSSANGIFNDIFYQTPLDANMTLAPKIARFSQRDRPLQATEVVDASQLYPVTAAGVFQPDTVNELKALLRYAQQNGLSVSLSGSRHSMGGQNLGQDMLHLDMTQYSRIHYESRAQTVRVESGATWKQIQRILSKHGRAIRVMQDSNIFTVGGSLSANVHGKDPRYGSLIESVISFDLLTVDGALLHCSRDSHPDLFKAVIGGMGLLGIITEVELKTDPNTSYQTQIMQMPTQDLIPTFERLSQDPNVELIEAQLSISQDAFLSEAQLYSFHRTEPNRALIDDVSGEQSIGLRKLIYQFSRTGEAGRQFRWWVQNQIGPTLEPEQISRNSAMAAPYRMLQLQDTENTDILQEYFIPTAHVDRFLKQYADILRANQVALQNVTVRKMRQDTEALVSYANEDMYAFVSYYQVKRGKKGEQQMQAFTQALTHLLSEVKGTFYLAYRPYGSQPELIKMYPNLQKLFALKQIYDPRQVLSNEWYKDLQDWLPS